MLCSVTKPFHYNGRYSFSDGKNTKLSSQLEAIGKSTIEFVCALVDSGRLLFPTEDTDDLTNNVKGYKTFFGPVFYSGALCYTKESLTNLSGAFTRLSAKRMPETNTFGSYEGEPEDYDEWLRHNQERAFDVEGDSTWHNLMHAYLSCLVLRVRVALTESLGEWYDVIVQDAGRVHQKRKLRMQSLLDLLKSGTLLSLNFVHRIAGKLKCPEWAKPGKFGRMIGDYTCPGSLLGGALCSVIKHCFEPWFIFNNLEMRFVFSPVYSTLCECFTKLWESASFVCVYHSDDCCIGIPCEDGRFCANLDISSCDTSHTNSIFALVLYLVSGTYWYDVMVQVVKQCGLDLAIRNPRNPREKVVLESNGYVMYSGTVLTTLLNNIATSMICLSIWWHCQKGVKVADCEGVIHKSAAFVGYKVTVQRVNVLEEYQFLKVSPTMSGNEVTVFLNLGVVLRSLGSCDGDLPGRGSIEKRAYQRNCEIVSGYAHAGDNAIIQALRCRFSTKVEGSVVSHWLIQHMEGFDGSSVSPLALATRYGIEPGEISYLCEMIRRSNFGDVIVCEAIRKIYSVDYGL